jgi:hypothetical protein
MKFAVEDSTPMDEGLLAATVERMVSGSVVAYTVSQAEVRNGDWSVPARIVAALSQRPELIRAAGSLVLKFKGFEQDDRSIPEIPECKAWLLGFEKDGPALFFLLEPKKSLPLLAYCYVPFEKKDGQLVLDTKEAINFYLNCAATAYEIGKTYEADNPRLVASEFLERIGMGGIVNDDLLDDFARANGD